MYLVIHDNHSATEEIVVGDDAREPLGGWVLSVNSYTVAIQWIGTWRYQEPETLAKTHFDFYQYTNLITVPLFQRGISTL